MTDLPELYWSPGLGVVIRSEGGSDTGELLVLHLDDGQWLKDLPTDAVRLVAGRAAAELPRIPDTFRFERDRVSFVTYEGSWHIFGPARRVRVGREIWVERFSDDTNQQVRVGPHVAERTVRHQDGKTITYVIAMIDRGNTR